MQIVREKVSLEELKEMSKKMYQDLVKAVVDIEKEVMVLNAEFHSDEEEFLLREGSKQDNLWGINLHPDNVNDEKWVEFDSMINIRPRLGNKSRYVEDANLRKKIISIVNKLVQK